jgi:hypothetical protein
MDYVRMWGDLSQQYNDFFGSSVAVQGDYYIVGASGHDGAAGANSGAVYSYMRAGETSWDNTRIIYWDLEPSDSFGRTVSLDGGYLVVGAPGSTTAGTGIGAAYVFQLTGTNTWDTGYKIIASDGQEDDQFGSTVSISGDYVVAGVCKAFDGAAYVFNRTGVNTWDSGTKISGGSEHGYFGCDVSISGDYVAVGMEGLNSYTGGVHVFHRTGVNAWDESALLTAPDGQEYDRYATSVSISGDYVAVGATTVDGIESSCGAVYVHHRTGPNSWDSGTRIDAPDPAQNAAFGSAVSISGEYLVVGSPGISGNQDEKAYVYRRTGVDQWYRVAIVIPEEIGYYGTKVANDNHRFIVGSKDFDITDRGSAYLYFSP